MRRPWPAAPPRPSCTNCAAWPGSDGKDFAGAIDDYTQALALEPGRAPLYTHRGWAYLVSDAPRLALHDFEEAVRLAPASPDAYTGRGSARVLHGQHRPAVADAEESLRRGEATPRTPYNAARIYAQAAAVAADHVGRRGRDGLDASSATRTAPRPCSTRPWSGSPPSSAPTFWRDVIHADDALRTIRQRPRFTALSARFASSPQ